MVTKAAEFTSPVPAYKDWLFHTQGRSEQRGTLYSGQYVEPLIDPGTQPADLFNILLELLGGRLAGGQVIR